MTIASRLGQPAVVINEALPQVQARCHGCIAVTQPYPVEARFTITLVSWAALARLREGDARAMPTVARRA